MKSKKILVIHTAFPGDLILLTPLLKAIKDLLEPGKITLMTTPEGKEICDNFSFLTDIIVYDKKGNHRGFFNFLRFLKNLRRYWLNEFDVAIIPHRHFRSAFIAMFLRVKERIGFIERGNLVVSLLYTRRIERKRDVHEVERNLDLIKDFVLDKSLISSERYHVGIPCSDRDFAYIKMLLLDFCAGRDYILIAPASNWFTKAWPPEYFLELTEKLTCDRHRVILIASSKTSDKNLCDGIEHRINDPFVLNLAGKTSFPQLAALCKNASLMITNDSAPMHIGASLNIPLIAIFGSTTTDLGFYPFSPRSIVAEKSLSCRPCGLHGRTSCPEQHFRCMLDISVGEIYNLAKKLLNPMDDHFP